MFATPSLEPLPPAIPDRYPRLIDVHTAALLLTTTPARLAALVDDGTLPFVRVGRSTRLRLSDLNALHHGRLGPIAPEVPA